MHFEQKDWLSVPEDGVVELRGVFVPEVSLHVVDQGDRHELELVTLLSFDALLNLELDVDFDDRHLIPPGLPRDELWPEPIRSPVDLQGGGVYWARAPGYAWGRIHLITDAWGDRWLGLERECSLAVQLTNYRPESGALLRLRNPSDGINDQDVLGQRRPTDAGLVSLRGLASGSVKLSVELGAEDDQPLSLGAALVELSPGMTRRITIALSDPPPRLEPVVVAGTLYVPPAWEQPEVELSLELYAEPWVTEHRDWHGKSAAMEQVESAAGLYRFDAGLLKPGIYEISVWPMRWFGQLKVEAPESTGLRIEVPPPAELLVEVVNDLTDQAVPMVGIYWRAKSPLETQSGWPGRMHSIFAGHEIRILAPVGTLELFAVSMQLTLGLQVVELHPGLNRFVWRATPLASIKISLFEGDVPVPIEFATDIQARSLGGSGERAGGLADYLHTWIQLTASGRYEITLGAVQGFGPVPAQIVEARAGETVDLNIQLERP